MFINLDLIIRIAIVTQGQLHLYPQTKNLSKKLTSQVANCQISPNTPVGSQFLELFVDFQSAS
jgi:hypothetical protein